MASSFVSLKQYLLLVSIVLFLADQSSLYRTYIQFYWFGKMLV